MLLTSELFEEITDAILLSPTAQQELKTILSAHDGEEIEDDLE